MPTAKKAIVGCLIGGQDIVIHEVYRDEKLIAALLEEEYAFLAHLENKTEPPIGSMRVEGETYNMEPDVAEITLRYLEISKSITSLTKEQDILKKALKQMVGEGNTQESESLSVSFGYRERTTLDEKAVVDAYPDIPWDNYKKTIGYYQITAKERKK
jgi:predicted phage-related endonuclease